MPQTGSTADGRTSSWIRLGVGSWLIAVSSRPVRGAFPEGTDQAVSCKRAFISCRVSCGILNAGPPAYNQFQLIPPRRCIMDRIDTDRHAAIYKRGASGFFDKCWVVALMGTILAGPAKAEELRAKPSAVAAAVDRGLGF